MYEVLCVIYLAVYLIAGYFLARVVFADDRPLIRLLFGGVFGLVLLMWLPAVFSFIMGFTLLAQLVALVPAVGVGLLCWRISAKRERLKTPWKGEWPVLATLLPVFALGVILFLTHTIPNIGGTLHAGQSTYGDLSLHLGLTTSIAVQGTFPPQYSILPGTAVGYPFLCDSVSSTFYLLGASLRFSMLLPALLAFALVLLGLYCFFERWLQKRSTVVLATLLFLIGGGFGFAYFFDLLKNDPSNFTRIFTGFYQTPTNLVDFGIKWVNPIADMLVPQRATLFGWSLLFPGLYLLRRAAFEEDLKCFLPLGILMGLMPLVHTHSFVALAIFSLIFFLRALLRRPNKKLLLSWLLCGVCALLLSLPQLLAFTFAQSGSFLHLHFNWANETDGFFWFYIKNLGLLFILLPVAFFRLEKREKVFCIGAIVLWILAEFVQFQPNPYDNNKLLFVCYAFVCGIVAKLLTDIYAALQTWKGRKYLAVIACIVLFLSGVLTLGRELVSDYAMIDSDQTEAAAFVQENAAPDALFLTATNHNNAIAALTGRNILCGTGAYLYFHGLDYLGREEEVRMLYEQPEECLNALRAQYGIDYAFFGAYERYQYACDERYYALNFPVVFQNEGVTIYDLRTGA